MQKRNEKGQFVKGSIPWIKGKTHTKETKEKISQLHKNKPSWNKGISMIHSGSFKKGNDPKRNVTKMQQTLKRRYVLGEIKPWNYGQRNSKYGYYYEAKRTIKQNISRELKKYETVHHIDHDITNNHIDNLYLFPNQAEHTRYHEFLRRLVREII